MTTLTVEMPVTTPTHHFIKSLYNPLQQIYYKTRPGKVQSTHSWRGEKPPIIYAQIPRAHPRTKAARTYANNWTGRHGVVHVIQPVWCCLCWPPSAHLHTYTGILIKRLAAALDSEEKDQRQVACRALDASATVALHYLDAAAPYLGSSLLLDSLPATVESGVSKWPVPSPWESGCYFLIEHTQESCISQVFGRIYALES
jgi:hypothetical protein